MSIRTCLKKVGVEEHEAAIIATETKDNVTLDGLEATEAARQAVQERIDVYSQERADIIAQVEQQGGQDPSSVSEPASEPTAPRQFEQQSPIQAQRNRLGLFSALEQAALNMRLPQWKKGGTAKGDAVWAKISKETGVKKEELEWTGLEEFLDGVDKISRDGMVQYLAANGVQVEETVAEAQEGQAGELDFQQTIWDDSEAWDYRVEDLMSDFDNDDRDDNIHDGNIEKLFVSEEKEIREKFDFEANEVDPDIKDFSDSIKIIEWVENNFASTLREMYENDATEVARNEYFDDPITINHDMTSDIYIFGNEGVGYQITTGNFGLQGESINGQEAVYSYGEAVIQAEEYARNEGLLQDGSDNETARWEEYIVEGEYSNYREIKIKLPDIAADFINETHFPDEEGIVAFMRVTDRELSDTANEIVENRESEVTYSVKQNPEGVIDAGLFRISAKDDTGKEIQYSKSFATKEEALSNIPTHGKTTTIQGGVKTNRVNTFLIDEGQSDLHTEGRERGYKTGIDSNAVEAEANQLRFDLTQELEIGSEGYQTLKQIVVGNDMLASILEGSSDVAHVSDKIQEASNNPDIVARVKEIESLHEAVRVERSGAPNAPFKGDSWLQLAMRTALVRAVNEGYDAFAWEDSNSVQSRWSENYDFSAQYDRKMPSMIKKMTKGTKAVHLTMDGEAYNNETSELGYWTIPITDELRQQVQTDSFPLFQESRGDITFTKDGEQAFIRLKEASDFSTFLHESGHLFLEMELKNAVAGAYTEDQQAILEWLEVDSFEKINTKQHEKWARGFEAYLMEGKAPSIELQSAFRSFASWLKQIYINLVGLESAAGQPIQLSDDIRAVMDRMLATDEQIAEVEAANEYNALFTDAAAAGMTPKEFEVYKEQEKAARDKPRETLQTKILRELQRTHRASWKDERASIAEKMVEQLKEQPIYKAIEFLKGSTDSSAPNLRRLNSDVVKDYFAGEVPKELRSVSHKDAIMHPDEIAEKFGFKSGKEMMDMIVATPPIKQVATEAAQQQMLQKHGDILNDGSLEQEAQLAAHDTERGKLMLSELRVLARNSNSQAIDRKVIKEQAITTIGNIPVGELRPDRYRSAEVRAAVNAQKALDKGDVEAAHDAKLQQVINFHLYRQARAAKTKAEALRKRHQSVTKRKFSPKKYHPDFIGKMKQLIVAFDFRKNSKSARDNSEVALNNVNRWIQDQLNHETRPAAIATHSVLTEIKHWSEMTLSELQGLDDVIKSLRYTGKLMSDESMAEERETHSKVATRILDVFKDTKKKAEKNTTRRFMQDLWSYYSSSVFLHADQVLRRLGGFKDNDIIYNTIKKPIDDAVNNVLIPSENKAADDMDVIYERHYTVSERRDNNVSKLIEGTDKSLSKWESVVLGLYWGSESSRQSVLASIREGKQEWTEQSVSQVLATLDARDWAFIADVHAYNETHKGALFALEKRRKGVAPMSVEAAPFNTAHGKQAGGYHRIYYDASDSIHVSEVESEDLFKSVMLSKAATARTPDGMTMERVGSGGKPISLNIGNWHKATNETLVLLALGETIEKVQRVIASKEFKTAMEATQNQDHARALDLWLKDTAIGEVVAGDPVSKIMRRARTNLTATFIGYKVSTILIQPTGILQSMPIVGYGNILKGSLKLLSSAVTGDSVIKHSQTISKVMAERATVFNKDIQNAQQQLHGTAWMPSRVPKWAVDSMFAGIVYMQRFVDVAVFLGATEQAKKELGSKANESDVIAFAERQVVRTQSGNVWTDRTPIERGSAGQIRQAEWIRMWTLLSSYMFFKGNLIHEALSKEQNAFKKAMDTLVILAGEAIVINIIAAMFRDDDDEREIVLEIIKDTGLSFAGSLPLIRELGSELSGFESGPVLTKSFKIASDATLQATQVVGAAGEGQTQEELDLALFKAMTKLLGATTGIPASQINLTVGSIIKEIQGEEVDPLDYLLYREK